MKHHDSLNRYLFERADVRGEIAQLTKSYQQILANKNYPAAVQNLLGELLTATSLLTATLKFEGDITVQIQGDGPIKMMAINGTHEQKLRGIANFEGEVPITDLQKQVGKGLLVITITPENGERYQGIVSLAHPTLAECLQEYFAQSEQLATHLWLFANGQQAAGILLQALPSSNQEQKVELEHLAQLTNTIKNNELFTLDAETILHRLYHQEELQLFEPTEIEFFCGCSHERTLLALSTIDQAELEQIMAEQGSIEINCGYCDAHYSFDSIDLVTLREGSVPGSNTTQ